jgi:cytochrome c553
MIRNWRMAAATALAIATGSAAQEATPPKLDLTKAQQTASQICAACHGADGNSSTSANPNLAGQHADYITLQLMHFKSGVRSNPVMQGMAAMLSDDDMRALGVYFSQQKPKGLTAKDAQLVKAAQKIYRGGDETTGLPACAGCHSPTGAGIPKNYPRVAGQYADYTYAQLRAFKNGERGADKAGKDGNGRIMATIANRMTDDQMKAVADYMAGLRN